MSSSNAGNKITQTSNLHGQIINSAHGEPCIWGRRDAFSPLVWVFMHDWIPYEIDNVLSNWQIEWMQRPPNTKRRSHPAPSGQLKTSKSSFKVFTSDMNTHRQAWKKQPCIIYTCGVMGTYGKQSSSASGNVTVERRCCTTFTSNRATILLSVPIADIKHYHGK